jgi:hypothetical protein
VRQHFGLYSIHRNSFTPGFSHAMNLVGGLVSALVIGEVAVTKPGEAPVARAIDGATAAPTLSWTLTMVTARSI